MEDVDLGVVKYYWLQCPQCKLRARHRAGGKEFKCRCGWRADVVQPPAGEPILVHGGGKKRLDKR